MDECNLGTCEKAPALLKKFSGFLKRFPWWKECSNTKRRLTGAMNERSFFVSFSQGVWVSCPLHGRVQHESSRQAKTPGKVVERPGDPAPVRAAEGILRLLLKPRPPKSHRAIPRLAPPLHLHSNQAPPPSYICFGSCLTTYWCYSSRKKTKTNTNRPTTRLTFTCRLFIEDFVALFFFVVSLFLFYRLLTHLRCHNDRHRYFICDQTASLTTKRRACMSVWMRACVFVSASMSLCARM